MKTYISGLNLPRTHARTIKAVSRFSVASKQVGYWSTRLRLFRSCETCVFRLTVAGFTVNKNAHIKELMNYSDPSTQSTKIKTPLTSAAAQAIITGLTAACLRGRPAPAPACAS